MRSKYERSEKRKSLKKVVQRAGEPARRSGEWSSWLFSCPGSPPIAALKAGGVRRKDDLHKAKQGAVTQHLKLKAH
jgi:hypothetical protein